MWARDVSRPDAADEEFADLLARVDGRRSGGRR
jgi:hypothetical protein